VEFKAKNAQVIGVSFDTIAANRRFAEKYDFPFPLLCDTDRKIGVAYGAADSEKDEYARRIAYVIDEQGTIAQAHEKVDAAHYPSQQVRNL
jgi:peroxiredoxin Q/BCP